MRRLKSGLFGSMLVVALGSGCSVEPETDDLADALT